MNNVVLVAYQFHGSPSVVKQRLTTDQWEKFQQKNAERFSYCKVINPMMVDLERLK